MIQNKWVLYLVKKVIKSLTAFHRDRPSPVGDHRHMKVKPYEEQQLKLKNHLLRRNYYILKKVLHFKISAIKENIISNRKFYLSKRKFCN